ncbi:hypothetical protein Ancab_030322 [Ancistrocladus abbreviatus]
MSLARCANKRVKLLKTCNTCINDVLLDELLVEILHRLPSKLAAQCKLVCKRWFSIVSSSYFLRCFIMHSDKGKFTKAIWRGRQLLMTPDEPGLKFSLKFLPCFNDSEDVMNLRIMGSCNDLLLCCIRPRSWSRTYYVCNPFTKKWVELPRCPACSHKFVHVGFICDPPYHYHMHKQDIVINSNRSFKVVHLSVLRYSPELLVEMFSSETGRWSKQLVSLPEGHAPQTKLSHGSVFCFNMKLYWPASKGVVIYDPSHGRIHGVLTNPVDRIQDLGLKYLGQSDGSLWAFQERGWDLYIWQAKYQDNNGVNWSSRRWVNLWDLSRSSFIKARTGSCRPRLRLLAMHPGDPNILYLRTVPPPPAPKKINSRSPMTAAVAALPHLHSHWNRPRQTFTLHLRLA